MNSRVKELLSNTMLFTIANMGSKILVFFMVPLYTAVLTTDEYGISDIVHTTVTMLMPILTLMISDAVLRFCFKDEYDKKEILSIGIKIIVLGTIICALICLSFFWVPFFEPIGSYIIFIPFMFVASSGSVLLHRFARGIDHVKDSAYCGLVQTIFVIVLNLIFLLLFHWGVFGYLLAYTLSDVAGVIFLTIRCNVPDYMTRSCSTELRKEMLNYSIPLVPNSLSWWALSSINRYIIMGFLGISAVGIYSATLRIPTILTVLSDIFAQAWLLSALKDYNTEESRRFIKAMHNRYFSVLIVITGILILLSHPIASFLLSGEFSSQWVIIPFLFISVFWGGLVGFLGSIYSAECDNKLVFISTVIGCVVSIVMTLLLIKSLSVLAVAIATLVGYYVIWLIRRMGVNKYINVGYNVTFSSIQGVIVAVEAYFVYKELYIIAACLLIVLFMLNYRNVTSIAVFFINEGKKFLYSKFVGRK